MRTIHLTPAYGRDYKSRAAIKAALEAGLDFILHDPTSPWDGRPCSPLQDFAGRPLQVRYSNLRETTVFRPGEVSCKI